MVNADTGKPLYLKNDNKAVRILSITKLITAYVLVQRLGGQLSDTVTITQAHLTSGSTAGLRKGDIWSLRDLLYGMLLVSGNDASLAIADHIGRAILAQEKTKASAMKRFVQEMRADAAALGAKQRNSATPTASPRQMSRPRATWGCSGAPSSAIELAAVLALRSANALHRRPERANDHAHQHHRDDGRKTISLAQRQDRMSSKNIYHLVVGWRAPNGQTIVAVVLGSASHPARYDDMRAILATLPHDFPELAAPATGTTQVSGQKSASRQIFTRLGVNSPCWRHGFAPLLVYSHQD